MGKIAYFFSEFTEWFLKEVSHVSHSIGLSYSFEKHPTVVRYVVPGDMSGCVSAYRKIHEVSLEFS